MYLCQFFSLSHLIFHSARKIVENFPIERRHNRRPMRTGGAASGVAGIAVLFLSRRETRPENLNINYFFKFLISIDFMMQIMFSDFRFCRAGAFLLVLRHSLSSTLYYYRSHRLVVSPTASNFTLYPLMCPEFIINF